MYCRIYSDQQEVSKGAKDIKYKESARMEEIQLLFSGSDHEFGKMAAELFASLLRSDCASKMSYRRF